MLIQAGVSEDGQNLAAQEADLVFTVNTSMAEAQARYTAMKALAAGFGRTPDSMKILPGLMPVVGETAGAARAAYEALQALTSPEIGIAYLSDLVDHDLSAYPADGPLPDLPMINGGVGRFRMIERLAREDGLNLGQIAHRMLLARGHWTVVGTPAQVADEMERWFTNGACDGFNILAPHHPGGLESFVDLVVPELQRRALFRQDYTGDTLREHLGLSRPTNRFAARVASD